MSVLLPNSAATSSTSAELESSTESSVTDSSNSVTSSTNTPTNTGGASTAETEGHTGTSSGDGKSSMVGSTIRSTLQARPITTTIEATAVSTSNGQTFTTVIGMQSVLSSGAVITTTTYISPSSHLSALSSSSFSSTSSNTGALIGGIVGGIVGLVFILIALFVIYRRWQRKHDLDKVFDAFDGDFDPDRIAVRKNGWESVSTGQPDGEKGTEELELGYACDTPRLQEESKGNSRKRTGGGRSDASDMALMTGGIVEQSSGSSLSPVAPAPVQGVPIHAFVHPYSYSGLLPFPVLPPNEMVLPVIPSPHGLPLQPLLSPPHLIDLPSAPVHGQTETPPPISPTRPSSSFVHENLIIADTRSESPLPLLGQQLQLNDHPTSGPAAGDADFGPGASDDIDNSVRIHSPLNIEVEVEVGWGLSGFNSDLTTPRRESRLIVMNP
ncbi:hypothetical protein GYMLUDRAFT_406700 [Collybiopsis luxurians FD-317 M1]|uniref:Uncharacterized protein n=1 Tax=Collybiopsis luxurians FD-317 M1 TaxID=944289 RepID=A0A0D0ALM9_9AGAR|nr:hypothetical protein GYMLUDRAFT_406700 [Collybiopsis luxurians FD-317 M1]